MGPKEYSDAEIYNILHPYVKEWFKKKFKTFCIPQKLGVIPIQSRKNVLISSPTGSGKTLTSFLSILNELIDSSEKEILEDKIYCIYISPLKALNYDISLNLLEPLEEIEKIAKKDFGIRVSVRTGDTPTSERSKMLKTPPHILITTPESLAILLSSTKFIEKLKDVQWCIIDEIHSLADNKRGVHLSLSIERLQRYSHNMSRIGLSATVAPLEEVSRFLVGNDENGKERDCTIIDVQYIKQMDLSLLSPLKDFIDTNQIDMNNKLYEALDELIQKHKTTLIFTNTRSATERVVDHLKARFPKKYTENIGAHHGSLSKDHRRAIEQNLRDGKLKVCVSSTSLELGIDIGYIDLVICLSSPKSVARFLQRAGRAGHKIHEKVKSKLVVLDRDDLVECAILLKSAIEKKIDRIEVPKNCLDILAQHIFGISLEEELTADELYNFIKQCYSYTTLPRKDFDEIINYLAGEYATLEDRHIYAKLNYDKESGKISRTGKMSRVIYMTNLGTIPDESFITAKLGNLTIGHLDERFLERLRKGDVFVLGGATYEFLYSKGMVAQVKTSGGRPPTVPRWVSERLPLSFDLGMEITRFRALVSEKLDKPKNEVVKFIEEYAYIDRESAEQIYSYFKEQKDYAIIPNERTILVEYYNDEKLKYTIFHTVYGRRVNDCLSRAIAYVAGKTSGTNIELGISDNGFYLASTKKVDIGPILRILKESNFDNVVDLAVENTQILARRFRHCAVRSLMILRTYMGRTKRVGRQQVSSMILYNALKRINPNFSIIREAKREVLEDMMDLHNSKIIVEKIKNSEMKIEEVHTLIPSPFALGLIIQGFSDVLSVEDRIEFVKRMHQMVMAKIALNEGKKKV